MRGGSWIYYGHKCHKRAEVKPTEHDAAYGFRPVITENVPTISHRVVRGGARLNQGRACRAAFRDRFHPDNRWIFLGFRPIIKVDYPYSSYVFRGGGIQNSPEFCHSHASGEDLSSNRDSILGFRPVINDNNN